MARQTKEAALRAQKERKQKMFLLLLVPLFLGLMAWQGPKTLKALRGGSPPPLPVSATPTPTPSPTTTSPIGSDSDGLLPDSDVQPGLLDGQLLSFSRFSGGDPFVGEHTPAFGGPSASEKDATVEVNGTSEDLSVGNAFPAGDPTFELASVSVQSATIGLVSGTFSNGDDTITINVGETLVLVADDGARYAIKLVSVAS
jgi:hypothetical protein